MNFPWSLGVPGWWPDSKLEPLTSELQGNSFKDAEFLIKKLLPSHFIT